MQRTDHQIFDNCCFALSITLTPYHLPHFSFPFPNSSGSRSLLDPASLVWAFCANVSQEKGVPVQTRLLSPMHASKFALIFLPACCTAS